MSNACFKIREQLLDHHFGELEGLEQQRVEAHLQNCSECRTVLNRLGTAFDAATDWDPEPRPGEVDRLVDRLAPYLVTEEAEGGNFGWVMGAVALAAGLMLFALLFPGEPRVEAPVVAERVHVQQPDDEPVVRATPTEHLRVVSSSDWNGKVETTGKVTRIEMDRGFAVMDFKGGDGRALIVKTPDAEIEVVGTRFYVDARDGVPTTVGVVAGQVKIETKKRMDMLRAGSEKAYRSDGDEEPVLLARSTPYHTDPFLVHSADPVSAPVIAKRPAQKRPKKMGRKALPRMPKGSTAASREISPPPPPVVKEEPRSEALRTDPVDIIGQAEKLSRKGQHQAGIDLIEAALATPEGSREPYQAMLRYTRARLLMKQGKRDQARAEFGRLTHAPSSEVSHQAQLSLCELELKDDPCTARACLNTIDSVESRQLVSRWRLSDLDCDQVDKSSR